MTTTSVQQAHKQIEFEQLFAQVGDKPYILDFTAQWCGPCKMIAPVFDHLSQEYPQVVFIKVDVDGCPTAAKSYNISAMPTFVLGRNGVEVDRLKGASEVKLQAMLQKI